MPVTAAGALDALQTEMRGFHLKPKRPQIISGEMTKIIVIVDDKNVKTI